MEFKPSVHSSPLEITGSISKLLENKRIVLGLTGSVAVVETVHLARTLMRHGAEVFVVMTKAARELIGESLLEWATGNPVIVELTGQIEHVHLCGQHPDKADLVLIAPSTANTIGKIAAGIDDTPVTTMVSTAFGTGIPIAIIPAMHKTMYENPLVKRNIEILIDIGVTFIGPRHEEGKAKIATTNEVVEKVISILSPQDFKNKSVVVTAGPTRIWIDDVRFISNPSSGKMGIALALEAAARGADVTLILGPTTEKVVNSSITTVRIDTPQDIVESFKQIKKIDYFISAGAIGDYQPEKQKGKLPSKQKKIELTLTPTPKILAYVQKNYPEAYLIGFKAETTMKKEELIAKAEKRLKEYSLEMIVANFIDKEGQGFGTEKNELFLITKDGQTKHLPLQSKRFLAREIFDLIKSE
jgi:phosphopantothenoylcysteine decarboxylase/phosphopantothenate--cysteine ligase